MTNFYNMKKEATNYIIKLYNNEVEEKTIRLNVLMNFGLGESFVDAVLSYIKSDEDETKNILKNIKVVKEW